MKFFLTRRFFSHLSLAVILASSMFGHHAFAQELLDTEFRTNGPLMHALVAPTAEVLQKSSAVIFEGRNEEVSFGTIISADGLILTKASEIAEKKELSARIDRRSYPLKEIIAIDPVWDVALIKVDAADLTPVPFAESSNIEIGTWCVANGAATRFQRRPMIGIISATTREIKADGGPVLGIALNKDAKGLLIGEIPEKSSAHSAGLKKGDIVTHLDNQPMKKREDVAKFMENRKVGDEVEVTFLREGKEQKAKVTLAGRGDTFGAPATRNDAMSGEVSKRRSGFPRVLQHDIMGNNKTCGGPLLDLDGKCIGMNIARANRCESFAIPVEELLQVIEKLKAKQPAP